MSSVDPPTLEMTMPDIHGSLLPISVKVVNTPSPAGIEAPVNENPRTVFPPVDTVKPASAAAPPAALAIPSILNWNPPISSLLL